MDAWSAHWPAKKQNKTQQNKSKNQTKPKQNINNIPLMEFQYLGCVASVVTLLNTQEKLLVLVLVLGWCVWMGKSTSR